jgi:putative oxygen-independent coproporphyrinogen III oxidase
MISLYLHIPFCASKCPYCDFYSVAPRPEQFDGYPGLLLKQARLAATQGWTGSLRSIFFGGGTPSLLSPEVIGTILTGLQDLFAVTQTTEVSLEANPGTLDRERLAGYRRAGVNRLSLGVQTLNDHHLQRLGRRHSAAQAREAVQLARAAGFDNLSVDLMFGLPGQSGQSLAETLEEVLGWQPEHLSVYGLTVEPGTPFAEERQAGLLPLPEEDQLAECFSSLHQRLAAAGYRHYEISNYARSGFECRHNLNYWQRGGYLGLGAGAHSFRACKWGERRAVPNDLDAFGRAIGADRDPSAQLEVFSREEAMRETVYLGLRMAEGVGAREFHQRFGCRLEDAFPAAVAKLRGMLQLKEGRWMFRWQDWLLYDHLIAEFF